MLKKLTLIVAMLFVVAMINPVQAAETKESLIEIKNLSINSIAFDDSSRRISVVKDLLPNGKLVVKGKVVVSDGKIANLDISLDGRETWQPITWKKDGTFQHTIPAEINREYAIYVRAKDGEGRTNDIQATGKLVWVSDRKMQSLVKETMDKLFDAYKAKNSRAFMALVSPDFAGDDILLVRAIRKDFTALDSYDIRYSLSNTAVDSRGRVAATVTYNITVTTTKTTSSNVKKIDGTTQLVFKFSDQGLKLYNMKRPVLFGFSDADNITTGTVRMTNSTTLKIEKGDVDRANLDGEVIPDYDEPHHPPYH